METLKPNSQETAQNFETRILLKCLRIAFYSYIPANPYHFISLYLILHIYFRLHDILTAEGSNVKNLRQISLRDLVKWCQRTLLTLHTGQSSGCAPEKCHYFTCWQCCRFGPGSMYLGLPDPDPLVRGTDPDPSIIKQK